MNEKFWVVWRESSSGPIVKQASREIAAQEAQRIAAKHGGKVYVLELVGVAEPQSPPITYTEV